MKLKLLILFIYLIAVIFPLFSNESNDLVDPSLKSNLVAVFDFEKVKDRIVFDNSGNNITGTIKGNPVNVKGITGSALLFNPDDGIDYIELENNDILDNLQENNYTICAWFKPLSVPGIKTATNFPSFGIVMKTGYHIGLSYTYEKRIMFNHYLKGDKFTGIATRDIMEPDKYHHIAGVVDRTNGTLTLYIDGWLVYETKFKPGGKAREFDKMPWRIGIGDPEPGIYSFPAHGIIDDVLCFNKALSKSEINSIILKTKNIPPDITVKYVNDEKNLNHIACGFLVSFSNDLPVDKYVKPLKPSLIRSGNLLLYERAKKLGAGFNLFLHGTYMSKFSLIDRNPEGLWPGDNGDWKNWEDVVYDTVINVKNKGYTDISWSIWFCPEYHWQRSFERYLETYKRAFHILKKIIPDAVIMGPWHTKYDLSYINKFLDYTKRNNILPDIYTWNEGTNNPAIIPDQADELRSIFKSKDIDISRLIITEIISPHYQFSPGHAVAYISNLHRAGIEATSKSCWDEDYPDGGINNCWNNSLDGLLDSEYLKPRSIWWAFKLYADMSGSIMQVTPQNNLLNIDGIASFDSKEKRIYILLGRYKRIDNSIKNVIARVESIPGSIQKNNKIEVDIRKIPDTEKKLLDKPINICNEILIVKDNTIHLVLPVMNSEDVYSIIIKPPE